MSRSNPKTMPIREMAVRDISQGMAKLFIRNLMKAKPPIRKRVVSISWDPPIPSADAVAVATLVGVESGVGLGAGVSLAGGATLLADDVTI